MDHRETGIATPARRFHDIETAISAVPLEVTRLTADGGGAAFSSFNVGGAGLMVGEFGCPIATSGDVAGEALVAALQLEEGPGSWNGADFSLDRAWIYEPGSEHAGVGRTGSQGRPPRFAVVSLPAAPGLQRPSMPSASVRESARVRVLRGVVLDGLAAAHSGELDEHRAALIERELTRIVLDLR